jgi:hypothetical protein
MEMSIHDEKPTPGEILAVLVEHYDSEPGEVLRWLDSFDAEEALAQHRVSLGMARETQQCRTRREWLERRRNAIKADKNLPF